MHTSPDVLALMALGENAGTTAELNHAAVCPDCSKEVTELARIADVGRSATDSDRLTTPSPQVWERISAELGLTTQTTTAAPAPRSGTISELGSRRINSASSLAASASAGRRFLALAVAAALALVAGIGIGIVYEQRVLSPENRLIASADLQALPKWAGTTGRAEVTADGRGNRELVLRMATPQPVDGELRVWLMKDSVRDPQNMGVVRNGEARIPIPRGMSLFTFPVVDVSDEPPGDTDDVHSGDSVARGALV